jgi:hypothetical protein
MTRETKEEFAKRMSNAERCSYDWMMNQFEEFFNSNICIPKGTNRHPNADIWHEWAETPSKQIEVKGTAGIWYNPLASVVLDTRIKQQEPIYEYKVMMVYSDGTSENTEKYFTQEEFNDFGFPKNCTLGAHTKRIRQ